MRVLIACAVHTEGIEPLIVEAATGSDLVIGADGGAGLLLAAGITPDLVVGDADSLSEADADALRRLGVDFELHPVDKDDTDLGLAVRAARVRRATQIVVVGATGMRLDHTLAALGTLAAAVDLRPEIIDPGLRGWILGLPGEVRLDLVGEGSIVSVQALSETASVSSVGLRWPLDGLILSALDARGVSNRVQGAQATVTVTQGVALVTTCGCEQGMTLASRAT